MSLKIKQIWFIMFLNKKLFANKSGFTLVEIVIASALLGITALIGASIMKISTKNSLRVKANSQLITQVNEVKQNLKKIKEVSWKNFNSTNSFSINNSQKLVTVGWTLADQDITNLTEISFDVEGAIYLRDSHTLEIGTSDISKSGVAFSRCVERSLKDVTLTAAQGYSLEFVPVLSFGSTGAVVHCCSRALSSCNNPINTDKSTYVLRTFINKSSATFKAFPLDVESDFVDGIGFMLTFNSAVSPSSYEISLISQTRACYHKDFSNKSCNGNLVTKIEKFGGIVKANGVNDNGIIQIR